jgi:hypothetical protein
MIDQTGCDKCDKQKVCHTYQTIKETLVLSPYVHLIRSYTDGIGYSGDWRRVKEMLAHHCDYGSPKEKGDE